MLGPPVEAAAQPMQGAFQDFDHANIHVHHLIDLHRLLGLAHRHRAHDLGIDFHQCLDSRGGLRSGVVALDQHVTVHLPGRYTGLFGEQILDVAQDLRHVEAAYIHLIVELRTAAGPNPQRGAPSPFADQYHLVRCHHVGTQHVAIADGDARDVREVEHLDLAVIERQRRSVDDRLRLGAVVGDMVPRGPCLGGRVGRRVVRGRRRRILGSGERHPREQARGNHQAEEGGLHGAIPVGLE
jgi:hypothetical protein